MLYSELGPENWYIYQLYPDKWHDFISTGIYLPLDDPLTRIINDYTIPEKYFVLTIDKGGEPPTAQEIADALNEIQNDVAYAWHLAQLQKYLETKEEAHTCITLPEPPILNFNLPVEIQLSDVFKIANIETFLTKLENLPESSPIEIKDFIEIQWPQAFYPFPVLQILKAQHTNPFNILAKLKTAGLILLLTGMMAAGSELIQSNADAKLTEACAQILIEGKNPEAIKVCQPVANAVADHIQTKKDRSFVFKVTKDNLEVSFKDVKP